MNQFKVTYEHKANGNEHDRDFSGEVTVEGEDMSAQDAIDNTNAQLEERNIDAKAVSAVLI